VILLLNEIEKQIRTKKGVKDGSKALEVVETSLKYMNDRSPSVKMLLEYVALGV